MSRLLSPFKLRVISTLTVGRLAAFFVVPFGYFLIFLLWRVLWAKGLLDYSLFALTIFFAAEYLIILARWEKPSMLSLKLSPESSAITSAIIRGVLDCLPACAFLLIKQSDLALNQFVPFIYEAEVSMFASLPVLLTFWALAILIPFGLFVVLKRFRVILSAYLPLIIVTFGFQGIYNSYDSLTQTNKNLDPLVEVLCPRETIMKASGTETELIARDIYIEGDTVFASFGSISTKGTKPSVVMVRFNTESSKLDIVYGSTVKYFFSRPKDQYLYFADWHKCSIHKIEKGGDAIKKPYTYFMHDLMKRWDKSLSILSIIDMYVDRANENLYFSTDEVPACFKMNLKSKQITGEVNLLKLKLAVYGSGMRRIHVDPEERYMYLVPYAAPANIVKIGLDGFKIEKWRASDKRCGRLFVFYHDVAFDWNRAIGYGFTYDGRIIEAFTLSDLTTLYRFKTGLSPYWLQVRGARVLGDGRVIGVTYHGEIFLFDPEDKQFSILCERTGGRTDDIELSNGYLYLNNYAGIVRIPLDKLLERAERKAIEQKSLR